MPQRINAAIGIHNSSETLNEDSKRIFNDLETDKTQAIAMGVIVEQLIKKLSLTVDNFAKGLCMIANIVDKHQKNSILQITPYVLVRSIMPLRHGSVF